MPATFAVYSCSYLKTVFQIEGDPVPSEIFLVGNPNRSSWGFGFESKDHLSPVRLARPGDVLLWGDYGSSLGIVGICAP